MASRAITNAAIDSTAAKTLSARGQPRQRQMPKIAKANTSGPAAIPARKSSKGWRAVRAGLRRWLLPRRDDGWAPASPGLTRPVGGAPAGPGRVVRPPVDVHLQAVDGLVRVDRLQVPERAEPGVLVGADERLRLG